MSGKRSPSSKTTSRRRPPRKNHAAPRIVAPLRRREIQAVRSGEKLMGKSYSALFLCTGNSARSIMAEAILNHKGRPNFTAYSAGSHPSGLVRPEALKQIEVSRMSTQGLRSKSWDEFAKPDAPRMDFVFTVCDNAAKEMCPVWPGQPMTAHWGVPDPAAVKGSPAQIERAFRDAFIILDRRITLFLNLPLPTLGQLAVKREIDRIGQQ
jgi:arsenate reductase (thioredoxin)